MERCGADFSILSDRAQVSDETFYADYPQRAHVLDWIESSNDYDYPVALEENIKTCTVAQCSIVKINVFGPLIQQDNELVALVEPYNTKSPLKHCESSALVGTKVPIKICVEFWDGQVSYSNVGYILSLADFNDDGYLVYYFDDVDTEEHKVYGLRMLASYFSVCDTMDLVDKEKIRLINLALGSV
ncbi:hypothetical protein EON65_36800 [archaeon]|nr:MAG: hypothetical protein EON65_36800 [archaeon]